MATNISFYSSQEVNEGFPSLTLQLSVPLRQAPLDGAEGPELRRGVQHLGDNGPFLLKVRP